MMSMRELLPRRQRDAESDAKVCTKCPDAEEFAGTVQIA